MCLCLSVFVLIEQGHPTSNFSKCQAVRKEGGLEFSNIRTQTFDHITILAFFLNRFPGYFGKVVKESEQCVAISNPIDDHQIILMT